MEADLRGQSPRGYVVRAAEGGKEVVQRVFVCQIDRRQLQADSVTVVVEMTQMVISNGEIEETAVLNAGGMMIIVFCAGRRNVDQVRGEFVRRTHRGQW